jgi:hypothetical protein
MPQQLAALILPVSFMVLGAPGMWRLIQRLYPVCFTSRSLHLKHKI